ncbi:MAG: hypothetical protein ACE5L7_07985, partial [Candidatus Aminicenantales bacterium]
MKRTLLILSVSSLIILLFGFKDTRAHHATPSSAWWNSDWHFRIKVIVHNGNITRFDEPVELKVDFSSLLSSWGIWASVDQNSLRVIDQSDSPLEVLSQYDPSSGEIIWLTGRMDPEATKTYFIYFDTLDYGSKSPPDYYNTKKDGGILVLSSDDFISVIYKIKDAEYEVARIDERNGHIRYLKPPYGNALFDGGTSYLGYMARENIFSEDQREQHRVFQGGRVAIRGGPVRYSIEFQGEPREEDSFSDKDTYYYTFYYVSNGHEVRAKLRRQTHFSQGFFQNEGGEWARAIGIQINPASCLDTAFVARDRDTASLFKISGTWESPGGYEIVSSSLLDNFWGVCGDSGSVAIIHPDLEHADWRIDSYKKRNVWILSASY